MEDKASKVSTEARKTANLSSATDEYQVNTEVFEIDETALAALTPEEQVQTLRTKFNKAKEEYVATVNIYNELATKFDELSTAESEGVDAGTAAAVTNLTPSDKTFKHDGKTYGFALPHFNLKGIKVTHDEILADKDLQAKMVEGKYGIIKEVTKPAKPKA